MDKINVRVRVRVRVRVYGIRVYVSELRHLTGLLFTPHMIYESGESRWNDVDRGKPKCLEKNISQFVRHKFHMD
jgi:hypothetical protein